MKVRQTACRYCGQDIENLSPYRKGEWRDRGNNTECPVYLDKDREPVKNTTHRKHAPVKEHR